MQATKIFKMGFLRLGSKVVSVNLVIQQAQIGSQNRKKNISNQTRNRVLSQNGPQFLVN